jgi:hypothetical protein
MGHEKPITTIIEFMCCFFKTNFWFWASSTHDDCAFTRRSFFHHLGLTFLQDSGKDFVSEAP